MLLATVWRMEQEFCKETVPAVQARDSGGGRGGVGVWNPRDQRLLRTARVCEWVVGQGVRDSCDTALLHLNVKAWSAQEAIWATRLSRST